MSPFSLNGGAWDSRVLADVPLFSYGPNGAPRADTGGVHTACCDLWYRGPSGPVESGTALEDTPHADCVVIPYSDELGAQTVAQQVPDPAGSGRRVWAFAWDRSRTWSSAANNAAGNEGRRRVEFRGTSDAAKLLPYGTVCWSIKSLRLDPSIPWMKLANGDYFIASQLHDTSANGYNKPTFSVSINGAKTTRSGDYPGAPSRWFALWELSGAQGIGIKRHVLQSPPTGRWLYTVTQYRMGVDPFFRAWLSVDGAKCTPIIDHVGDFGWPDAGTDYETAGFYAPSIYGGAVPVIHYHSDGWCRIRDDLAPGMTPDAMVAALVRPA